MAPKRNLRGEMPFLDHLEELRWRIFWSLIALVIATLIGFGLVYYYNVLELLIRPVRVASGDENLKLIYLSPSDSFFVTLKLAIYVGVLMAFPVIAYQIWSFLSPALEKSEKRAIVPALYLGLLLFAAGVAIAYFAALPVTLQFFQRFQTESLQATLEINKTLGFIVKMLFAFGAVFELPIVLMVLTLMGIVTPQFLREKRRHAVVAITVLASFITPGDAVTLTVMMMLPLVLLYELGIFLSAGIYRRRRIREEEPLEADPTPPEGVVEAQ
jgi:sec-independent protein translocase protein TatC